MAEAIRRAGGQSALARKLSEIIGREVKPQTIQYLARRTGKKPATGSRWTLAIARAAELHPDWPNDRPRSKLPANGLATGSGDGAESTSQPSAVELAQEVAGMELTRDAIALVRAWMALPENEREDFKRKIETASLRYRARVPDERLSHLAAPNSATARKQAERAKPRTKKRTPGTQ
jgi:hypothetical protein